MDGGFLSEAFVYLLAAVLAVPIAQRLGLGSVLGYLIAGVAIGPFGFGLAGDAATTMNFAGFGVVMMLFLVGLELRPARLWALRGPLLNIGGQQTLLTTAAIAGLGVALGYDWRVAVATGLILAGSCTALVLQILAERGLLRSRAGETIFSVLLFQDISGVAVLTILPLLAVLPEGAHPAPAADAGWIASLPAWEQALAVLGAIAIVILVGRLLTRPIFRLMAGTKLRELFTAAVLLLVIGIALLMETVGLSPALGTFLAGVVLADSEFRHEIEGDIEPFKGLLLGLFFLSVGAGIDFAAVAAAPATVAGLVLLLVALKAAVLWGMGAWTRWSGPDRLLIAITLAQGGEFAFVLLAYAAQNGVMSGPQANLLVSAVALSMAATPLLMLAYAPLSGRLAAVSLPPEPDAIEAEGRVVIAGCGRFGQIVGRMLLAQGHQVTVLDHDLRTIETLRRFGQRVFFGDAARLDLLQAAGAKEATLIVVATDEPATTSAIVALARRHFPQARLLARARDRVHAYELMEEGVDTVVRETFGSAIEMGVAALRGLGASAYEAERAGQVFRRHDVNTLERMARLRRDQAQYRRTVRESADQLAKVLERDAGRRRGLGWDASALVEEARASAAAAPKAPPEPR